MTSIAGWRSVPAVLALIATAAMIFAVRNLAHQAVQHRHFGTAPSSAIRAIFSLWRNPSFVASTGVLSFTSSALYIFLASAPFVLQEIFGLDEKMTGLVFMGSAVAGIIGTRLTGWVDQRTDAMLTGCLCALAGAGSFVVLSLLHLANPIWMVVCMTLLGIGGGIAGPATINNAIAAEPKLAGTGASMLGATQMLVSGAATIPLGLLAPITTLELALAIGLSTVLALLSALLLRLSR